MAKRFLAIKPSSFGDIIHLFPALCRLREKFPDAELDFLVNPEFASLLEFSPFPVRKIIIFERKKLGSLTGFVPALFRLSRELRAGKYDAVIDFQGLFRSGVAAGLTGCRVRAGFASPREKAAACFYNRKIAVAPGHAVKRCVQLVDELFGWESAGVPEPELPVSASGGAALPELPEKYIVLLPGTRWKSKQFPPELFASVIREYRKLVPDMAFVAAGGAAEAEVAEAVGENVINLAGKTTLPALFELLRRAEAVVGNDSGPLHAAAALLRPVFGFYGPTVPGLTGPWGKQAVHFQKDIECAGCLKRECPLPETLCHQLDAAMIARNIYNQINTEILP